MIAREYITNSDLQNKYKSQYIRQRIAIHLKLLFFYFSVIKP